jgi:hypothetical protein
MRREMRMLGKNKKISDSEEEETLVERRRGGVTI